MKDRDPETDPRKCGSSTFGEGAKAVRGELSLRVACNGWTSTCEKSRSKSHNYAQMNSKWVIVLNTYVKKLLDRNIEESLTNLELGRVHRFDTESRIYQREAHTLLLVGTSQGWKHLENGNEHSLF